MATPGTPAHSAAASDLADPAHRPPHHAEQTTQQPEVIWSVSRPPPLRHCPSLDVILRHVLTRSALAKWHWILTCTVFGWLVRDLVQL